MQKQDNVKLLEGYLCDDNFSDGTISHQVWQYI